MIMYTFHDIIVVTNRHLCNKPLSKQIEVLAKKKPHGIILREKDLEEAEYEKLAIEIMRICKQEDVPCILHFYPEAALRLECKNIHLPLSKFKEMSWIKEKFEMIGVSVHSLEEALEAKRLGATYLIAGHIFETDCKKGVKPRGLEFLRAICCNVSIPVYGIGGMNESNACLIDECGAAGYCMMSTAMQLYND
jgi:thiamine-phosphate diphosphorylase